MPVAKVYNSNTGQWEPVLVGDTGPQGPSGADVVTTQGDLIIGDVNGDPVRLPVGSADQVLTSDGTTVSFQDAGGGGGELYAAGSHTVSKDAGFYLIDTIGNVTIDSNPVSDGINNLDSFTSIEVSNALRDGNVVSTSFDNGAVVETFFADGLYLAGGNQGDLLISNDAITWTQVNLALSGIRCKGLSFGNSTYIFFTEQGGLATSPDGTTWTNRTLGFTNFPNHAAFGAGLFVVVGSSGEIRTSPDGITWTSRTSGTSSALLGVTFGDGLFVASGGDGSTGEIITSPDGITWTSRTLPGGTDRIFSVTYGDGLYVGVGVGGELITSPDGTTWTSRTSGETQLLTKVSYGDGFYVVTVSARSYVLTSTDGITWTQKSLPGGYSPVAVYFGDGLFVLGAVSTDIVTIAVEQGVLLLSELPTPIQP